MWSGRSSRPRHHRVLYFPRRRMWIMECSCKVWCRPCRRRPTPRLHSRLSWRLRLVAFDHRTLDEALSAACRQEGEMQQYLEEKKASQKRPAATFQWQDKKKAVYQAPQRPRPQYQGLSKTSAGMPARSASPSSSSSGSASYRKTRKTSSPSSSKEPLLTLLKEERNPSSKTGGKLNLASLNPATEGCSRRSTATRKESGHWGRLPQHWTEACIDLEPKGELFWRLLGTAKESFNDNFDPFGDLLRGKQELDGKPSCRQDLLSAASDLAVNLLE
ncbi:hypothetical protein Taro_001370, partial [Colocasia esculenta]|nr:hypothetical protein [Colocasia esculenta]